MTTVATLSGQRGTLLYCPECGDECSATPGDYFWMAPDEPFVCGPCGADMVEVRRQVRFVEVTK